MWAAVKGEEDAVMLLLSWDVDVSIKDKKVKEILFSVISDFQTSQDLFSLP